MCDIQETEYYHQMERKLLLWRICTTAVNVGHISAKASYHNVSGLFMCLSNPPSTTFSVSVSQLWLA